MAFKCKIDLHHGKDVNVQSAIKLVMNSMTGMAVNASNVAKPEMSNTIGQKIVANVQNAE